MNQSAQQYLAHASENEYKPEQYPVPLPHGALQSFSEHSTQSEHRQEHPADYSAEMKSKHFEESEESAGKHGKEGGVVGKILKKAFGTFPALSFLPLLYTISPSAD